MLTNVVAVKVTSQADFSSCLQHSELRRFELCSMNLLLNKFEVWNYGSTLSCTFVFQRSPLSFALVRTNPSNASPPVQPLPYRKLSGAACHPRYVPQRMVIQWLIASMILRLPLSYVICAMTRNTAKSPLVIMYYNPQGLNTAQVLINTWLLSTRACQRNTSLYSAMARQQSWPVDRDGKFILCQLTGAGIHPPPALRLSASFSLAQTQQIVFWRWGHGVLERRVVL